MGSTDIDGSPIVILRQEVFDEYEAVHKSDKRVIAGLEKEVFELRCALAEAKCDIIALKQQRADLHREIQDIYQ